MRFVTGEDRVTAWTGAVVPILVIAITIALIASFSIALVLISTIPLPLVFAVALIAIGGWRRSIPSMDPDVRHIRMHGMSAS